jgi:exopolyphosphatase/guanosine-5'-triphosphate,3'-diphosphate pyrophosphatase
METIAIIDLGTNTFHLLIAEISDREDFRILDKYKEPVKLGEGGITSGKISPKAFARGIRALKKFRKLIDSKHANVVKAFGTSAIRGAKNSKEFIDAAMQEAGIDIRVINGNEEASLIFEGVRNGVQLPVDENTLLVDIGGGSVEFIVNRDGQAQLLRSLDLGAARLLERVLPSDPIHPAEVKKVQTIIEDVAGSLIEEIKEFNISAIVGSSGTFETLGAIVARRKKDMLSSENLNSYRFNRKEFLQVHHLLVKSTRAERLEIPGMDPLRVDMIVIGTLLVEVLVQKLNVQRMMVSSFALKEGILYRHITEQRERVHKLMGNSARSLRSKAVRNLAEKYNYHKAHTLKVSELAGQIYDQLGTLNPFGKAERDLLLYGAILHDIGHFVNRSSHHKHGQYLVLNSGLSGFSHDELIILGNIVRYHRKSFPTRDHFHFKVLEQRHRNLVRLLAGILRIADNLDRGHRNMVRGLHLNIGKTSMEIVVDASDDVDIELQAAGNLKGLLEEVLERSITFRQK